MPTRKLTICIPVDYPGAAAFQSYGDLNVACCECRRLVRVGANLWPIIFGKRLGIVCPQCAVRLGKRFGVVDQTSGEWVDALEKMLEEDGQNEPYD